jgi:hypothetical protein
MDYHEGSFVDIPGLGEAYVTAGVDFYSVRFGPRYVNTASDIDAPALVVNGKTYPRAEVTARVGMVVDFYGFEPTDSARAIIREKVATWLGEWSKTALAQTMLAATVTRHNEIHRDQVEREIRETREHLTELSALLDRINNAGPTEYVTTYDTTYKLETR